MSRVDKIKEKRRLARLQKSQQLKKQIEELDIEELEDGEDEVVEEPVKKDYGESVMPAMPPATSFTELDKYKEMQERAEKVQEVSWEVRELISNILYYSDLKPNEKADAIQKVGSEFGARVQSVMSEDVSQMSKSNDDMDLLVIKSMLATDARHAPLSEKFTDWVSKKKLTAAAENKLSDDEFALVYTDANGNKVRKYPIHDKAHVRNALARAAQMIAKGGEAAADARKALPKIRSAAKKMGIGMAEKSALIVEKAADGNWRMVGFPTNKFIDWHGEILSEQAQLEYVDWANKNMDCSPITMSSHIPETVRENRTDFVGYENGFLIVSSRLTEAEAAGLLRAQEVCDLGMSHTSIVLERDPNDRRVITKYRMVEVTDLPLDAAANPFTSLELIEEANMAINTKDYLAAILGSAEQAEKFLEKAGLKKKELEAANIPSKEKEEKTEEVTSEASPSLTMDQVIEQVSKEFSMAELSAQFAELKEKAEKVEALEALVKDLAQKKEDALAEMIQPKAKFTLSWMPRRASQSDETVLKENDEDDKKLAEQKPSGGWLSEISKTAPIQ